MKRLRLTSLILVLLLALAGAVWGAAIIIPETVTKNATSVVDYSIPWGDWLDGDTIVTSNWTCTTGITVAPGTVNQSPVTYRDNNKVQRTAPAQTLTTTWFFGGTVGQTYITTNRITTVAGRTELVNFRVTVK